MPRARARWKLPALKVPDTRRGRRACSCPNWARTSLRRVVGGGAHDDGKLLGLAGGMVVDGDVQILDVAVDPAHRREGIARKLLSHVSYDAQMLGCTTASLEVEDGNEGAIALYNALGFTEAGCRRGYYGAGKDAIVMTALLPLVLPVDNVARADGGRAARGRCLRLGAPRGACRN